MDHLPYELVSEEATPWRVGDMIIGHATLYLIVSETLDYVEQTGIIERFALGGDDRIYRCIYNSGLDYHFTTKKKLRRDFKAGLFTPYFEEFDRIEKSIPHRFTSFQLLNMKSYKYVFEYHTYYAVIMRLKSQGWLITEFREVDDARKDEETKRQDWFTVERIEPKKLYLAKTFLGKTLRLTIPVEQLTFVALA